MKNDNVVKDLHRVLSSYNEDRDLLWARCQHRTYYAQGCRRVAPCPTLDQLEGRTSTYTELSTYDMYGEEL